MAIATDAIARTIAAIHATSWKAAYRGLYSDRYLDQEADAERLRHWQQRVPQLMAGEGEIFLASIDGQAAGFLCIDVGTDIEWGGYVDNLHVLPAWRGGQLGGALLAHATAWARARGQRQLWLWVYQRNHAAQRFYQRAGWQVVQRKREPVHGGGSRMVLRMTKKI